VGDVLTLEVGPVIGAHTGPGMLAVVFWGAPV
jgi:fatty acid-binding protein DegV